MGDQCSPLSNTLILNDFLVVLFISATAVAGLMLIVYRFENFYVVLKLLLMGSGDFVVLFVGLNGSCIR